MSTRPGRFATATPEAVHTSRVRTGRIVAYLRSEVSVEWDGMVGPPRAARVTAALDDAALEAAARHRREAVLVFEGDDPDRPIVLALLRPAAPLLEALLEPPLPPPDAARVDAERIVLKGQEEIVLECGEASLTLRRDGTVLLKGVNVVSQARHVQKIRGGKVQIN